MIHKPDCWVSKKYDPSFGPMAQWLALKKLLDGLDLTDVDEEWLTNTSINEVDGRMAEVLAAWKGGVEAAADELETEAEAETVHSVTTTRPGAVEVSKTSGAQSLIAIVDGLFSDIGDEIEAIKSGALAEGKAREVAKFRTMQLRSMELLLQAGHLESKIRRNGGTK